MHDNNETDGRLETRLDAVGRSGGSSLGVSPLPDAVAACVRRCGRVRRVRLTALGVVPVALAAWLISMPVRPPTAPGPVVGEMEPLAASLFDRDQFPGLIGRHALDDLLREAPLAQSTRTASEHVFSLRDGHDAAMIASLLGGS